MPRSQQKQVSVDTARVNLRYTHISAPIDATLVAIVAQEGYHTILRAIEPVPDSIL